MVWVLAVTLTISYATLFYCFAVMVVPMREPLGASTAQLSLALSLAIAVNGAVAVPVGRVLDRHGARWVMSAGSVVGDLPPGVAGARRPVRLAQRAARPRRPAGRLRRSAGGAPAPRPR